MYLNKFFTAALTVLTVGLATTAAPDGLRAGIVSLEEMKAWVDAQDPSQMNIIGDPFAALNGGPLSALAKRKALDITVTFCSTRSGSVCTSPCTVTTGTDICINAPDTNCLSATGDVAFCDHSGCSGSCNNFNSCGTRLDNNFCATPGTKSIAIPFGA